MKVNYDEVERYLKFKSALNMTPLEDIEWVRDDGSKIEVHAKIIEDWNLIGMSNLTFVELQLARIIAGEQEELLKEIESFDNT